MNPISCPTCSTSGSPSPQQLYRYNPGVSANAPTPPAQNPNTLGIVPANTALPAVCYPNTTDGSGQTFNWNIETALWV